MEGYRDETRPPRFSPLDREREAERECNQRDRSQELTNRERAPQSFRVSRPEDREALEDRERERASEDSLDSSPSRACEVSGESQPKKGQSGQQATAASKTLLDPQPPKEPRRQKRARAHRPSVQKHFHPSRWTHVKREERKPHGKQDKVHPENPPHAFRPAEGREEEEEEAARCVTFEEVPHEEKSSVQGKEKSLKGETIFSTQHKIVFQQKFPTAPVTCQVFGTHPTSTPSTSGVGIPVQRGQECATFSAPQPRTYA